MKSSLHKLGTKTLIATAFLILSGCATIVSKSSYPISISSNPSGAKITIMTYLGKPYDTVYNISNQAYYCSELVYFAYQDSLGNSLFTLSPMTYNDPATITIFPVWKSYFDGMGAGAKFQNVVFKTQRFDFTRTSVAQGDINFKNAVFSSGEKDFQDSKFNNNEVSFINTDFGDGDISFINATFANANTSFKVAQFGYGKVDFHFAKFRECDISFERTDFGIGRTDFRTVEFGCGKVNFNRCTFGNGEVTFEGADSHGGKLLFRRTVFGIGQVSFEIFEGKEAEIIFEKVDFEKGRVSFSGAIIKNLTLSSCLFSDRVNLQVAYAESIDISDSIVRDIVDFRPHATPLFL